MKKAKRLAAAALMIVIITSLSACKGFESSGEKMHGKLEKVVELEKEFEDQQDPLVKLEKSEQEIYANIISLGLEKMDEIKSLSDEALASVAKREEYMNKEEESIQKSKEAFKKVKPIIEDMDEDEKDLKAKAEELYNVMIDRYEVHDQLYANYTTGLKYDKELYEMFKDKDVKIDALEEQINKINEVYQKVLANNEEFNKLTKQYNEQKLDFYKKAGVEIKVEETQNK
ncbi:MULTISPECIES: YkyA family protein [unclassified Niallia]|uniref:YkyA family protein n=1 Tax=Niallia TaxID=2837506 RepID=UPI001EDB61C9|nr:MULTISPECIES: YkyA family protein [unclassified Niallia]MCM3029126.1 YkyA family protein [Niallia sp. MER 6]MDL0434987.1 YkyA family protein [Niallia sp. SS-2023]UPO88793.1 YkyA family protein [Niallia sp. Man26]